MAQRQTALVGTGFMMPAHLEALRRLGDVTVVGVLGSTFEKSQRAADEHHLAHAYPDFEAVLQDLEIDTVHILTPNRFHYAMAKAALQAGKHVLCEKPLAMTSAESAELVALAAQSGLIAGVNYNIRFYPLCREARDIVRRGDLGEIYAVQGSYTQDWLLHADDYNWRVLAEQGGASRAVADIGTHWLDLIMSITGLRPQSVLADLNTVHPIRHRPLGEVETFQNKSDEGESRPATQPVPVNTEDTGSVLLRFDGGAQGALWVSQVTAGRKNCLRFEISGSKGALAWNSEHPEEMWVGYRDRPNATLIRDPALLSQDARAGISYPGGHVEGYPDTFKHCFRAFYDAIAAGTPSAVPKYPTFADGHREIVLVETILESHAARRWADVPHHGGD